MTDHSPATCMTVEVRRPDTDPEVFTMHAVTNPPASIACLCNGIFTELHPEKLTGHTLEGKTIAEVIKTSAGVEGYSTTDDDEAGVRRCVIDYTDRTIVLHFPPEDESESIGPVPFEDFIPLCMDVLSAFFEPEPDIEVVVISFPR